MKRVWHRAAGLSVGLLVAAMCAMPQSYTISARPGVVNYAEGEVSVNGSLVSEKAKGRTYLSANETLSTGIGKAEVLLTPGVFLRVGSNSEIRMISPTLTNTEVAVVKGEAMVEAAELVKENDIEVAIGNARVRLEKIGLYQFHAGDPPTAAVIDGKLTVRLGDKKVELGKNRQAVLMADLKSEKFNSKEDQDELYAWSKGRDQYDSAASYQAAKSVNSNSYAGGGGFGWGYGFSGFGGWGGPGWFWNPAFASYAWLPGDGAFFSPFGYGFFAPGYVAYAPVMYAPLGGHPGGVAVPVNPGRLPALPGSHPGTKPTVYTASGAPYHAGAMNRSFVGHVSPSGGHLSGNSLSSYRGAGGPSGGAAHVSSGGAAHVSTGGSPSGFAHASGGGMSSGGGGGHSSGGGGHR